MTPGPLPGRGRVLLVVGMVDGDGGIDIEVQPFTCRRGSPGSPRRGPRVCAGSTDPGQMRRVDPRIDPPPHRGRLRSGTKHVFPITAALPDAVDAVRPVGHRGGQIGEHRTRIVSPTAPDRCRPTRP